MNIDVELHRNYIERLLARLGEGDWTLLAEDSVEDWAASVNLPQRGVFIPAMAARASDGRRLIVIRRVLTDDIQRSVLGRFSIRGYGDQPELKDPLRFLEHSVLHEVAHHVLDTDEEEPCDAWAFSKMPRPVS